MDFYYILLFGILFCGIFELSNNRTKKTVIIILCVILTLIGGLRWHIGNDWDQYEGYFYELDSLSKIFGVQRGGGDISLEPGFVFLNSFVHIVFGEFYYYNLIICAFIQFTGYRLSYKISPRHPILFYICYNLMTYNLTPVRSGLSFAICCWAYPMIMEQKLKKYLLIVACAVSVHMQVLVFLPAYWIGKVHIKFKYLIIILVLSIIIGNIFKDYLLLAASFIGGDISERASAYADFGADYIITKQLKFINYITPFFFLCIYQYVKKKTQNENDEWWNFLLYGFVIFNLIKFIFTGGAVELARMQKMYSLVNVILFVYSITYFLNQYRVKRLLIYLFFYIYLSWQITKITGDYFFEDSNIPYKTIFDYHNIDK